MRVFVGGIITETNTFPLFPPASMTMSSPDKTPTRYTALQQHKLPLISGLLTFCCVLSASGRAYDVFLGH